MESFIAILQIIVSIALIVVILMQERSSGIGGAFGGGGGGSEVYQTRRGMQKFLLWATIILTILFAGLAIVSLII